MIVAQVFLEAMEGCHLLLGPLFVMQTAIFRVCPSAVVQIFAAVCFKESRPLVPSAIVGRLSCFVSSASLDCFRAVLAVALNRCSFSSGSQPKFFFLAAFGSTFLCGQFSHSPQTALSFLSSFTGTFESCLFPVSSKALFPLLGCFQGSPCSSAPRYSLPGPHSKRQLNPHNPSELGAPRPATPYQAPTPSGR